MTITTCSIASRLRPAGQTAAARCTTFLAPLEQLLSASAAAALPIPARNRRRETSTGCTRTSHQSARSRQRSDRRRARAPILRDLDRPPAWDQVPDGPSDRGTRQTVAVTSFRRVPLAPVLDGICLALFVALGRESHRIGRGVGWYFTVLWPFGVGWFVTALVVGLYTASTRPWLRLTVTWLAGIANALVLRGAVPNPRAFSTFAVVGFLL